MHFLPSLFQKGIGCYIQYTLNDYEVENLEPNVPDLDSRIETFRQIVKILGKGSVVWRFDPLILTDSIDIDCLLRKITKIGDSLCGYTEKLVFSFADISTYKKVGCNLTQAGVKYREWSSESMLEFAQKLSDLNRQRWNFRLATCAEAIDLKEYGIEHNRCIDPCLISRISANDPVLQNYLMMAKRDSGQRKFCGCILSKDIGSYNTCTHGCSYCYANSSPISAKINYYNHITNPKTDSII